MGQVVIVQWAGLLFNVEALSWSDWGWIMAITSVVLVIPEVVRLVKRACHKK